VGALDAAPRALFGLARAAGWWRAPALEPAAVREVLVLRLDRIGDVLMSLPALADLRAALPHARIRLAVGRWSEDVARRAPVDEVLVWSAPWAGRPAEGADSLRALLGKARAQRARPPDLALDLQGDLRANALLRLTGARARAGYANTGGSWLLTHVLALDETVSWVEENRRAVAALVGPPARPASPVDLLAEADRDFARRLLATLVARWAEVASRLQREFGGTVLVTGSATDRPLAAEIAPLLPQPPVDLTGRLAVRETMAVIGALDLFLSPDTGPMHMACAVGTPSLSVFGPSDPVRYFSGGTGGPGNRHLVARAELWCSPCNLIRQPPEECAGPEPPECLRLLGVEEVYAAAARLLRATMGVTGAVAPP
jgi:ADP-heptose:LPS heptosyltransferase